jgi:hypothetical protein
MFIVENVIFSRDDACLTLIAADGNEIKLQLEGDCCSSSYFDADTKLDVSELLGDTLLDVSYNFIGNEPTENDWEDIKNYALVLRTSRRSISLMWRNSSNGYYSGTVSPYVNGIGCRYDAAEAFAPLGVTYAEG